MPRKAESQMYACSPSAPEPTRMFARLYVAVDEPGRVRGCRARSHLLDEGRCPLRVEAAVLAEQLPQVGPVDELHREVEVPVLLAGAERPHDVRIREARRGADSRRNRCREPLVARERVVEDLQRDNTVVRLRRHGRPWPLHRARRAIRRETLRQPRQRPAPKSLQAPEDCTAAPEDQGRAKYNPSMDGDDRLGRARSFLIGGLVGASAALATARRSRELARRRRQRRLHPAGLAAFEARPATAS
jgi:hypothetical protein